MVVSSGDPSGIGLEIAFKAWLLRNNEAIPPFALVADLDLARQRAKFFNFDIPFTESNPTTDRTQFAHALPIIPLKHKQIDDLGVARIENAKGILESIQTAVKHIYQQDFLALVTCPIAKKNLYNAGFKHAGHTEFLADEAQKVFALSQKPQSVMMLVGPDLRTVPITIHIPLKDVVKQLTTNKIVQQTQIVYKALQTDFDIKNPRLVLAGLNPHAGEDGSLGNEEMHIIQPALQQLAEQNIILPPPFPADTLFHSSKRQTYDAAICMYHDQALIPIKTLYFDDGVNVTLGLPFVRTSPDHGTAFNIASQNIASPKSFITALHTAQNLAYNRRKFYHG